MSIRTFGNNGFLWCSIPTSSPALDSMTWWVEHNVNALKNCELHELEPWVGVNTIEKKCREWLGVHVFLSIIHPIRKLGCHESTDVHLAGLDYWHHQVGHQKEDKEGHRRWDQDLIRECIDEVSACSCYNSRTQHKHFSLCVWIHAFEYKLRHICAWPIPSTINAPETRRY